MQEKLENNVAGFAWAKNIALWDIHLANSELNFWFHSVNIKTIAKIFF